MTVTMFFDFSQVCIATSCSICVLVAISFAGVTTDTFPIFTQMSAFVAYGASIETSLELHGTTFLDCSSIPRILSSIKLVPRRMLTTSWWTACNVAPVKYSTIFTCRLIFRMTSNESLDSERRYTLSPPCRWALYCSAKKAFAKHIWFGLYVQQAFNWVQSVMVYPDGDCYKIGQFSYHFHHSFFNFLIIYLLWLLIFPIKARIGFPGKPFFSNHFALIRNT